MSCKPTDARSARNERRREKRRAARRSSVEQHIHAAIAAAAAFSEEHPYWQMLVSTLLALEELHSRVVDPRMVTALSREPGVTAVSLFEGGAALLDARRSLHMNLAKLDMAHRATPVVLDAAAEE